jgi:hypothetical protein
LHYTKQGIILESKQKTLFFIFLKIQYIQMNLKRQSDEDLDIVGNAMDDDEYRLVECKGLSNSLNAVEALHSKYEAIKAQLPG